MFTYDWVVQYYETDQMGVVHHSNYIRWMEEARVEFLDSIGYGFDKLEDHGVFSPVLGVECKYKSATKFRDRVEIEITLEEYNSVRYAVSYKMTNQKTGDVVCTGKTRHCFTNEEGKPVILKKEYPEFDNAIRSFVKGE